LDRPIPDPSQEGGRQPSASCPFPSRAGLGVGSWSPCVRKSERMLSWRSRKANSHADPVRSLPAKERHRGRVAVQKVPFAHRTDFAVAKKAGQFQRPQLPLNKSRVVVRMAEQTLPPSVATAQAPAKNRGSAQLLSGARQQLEHVFRRRGGVPALELDGLAQAGQPADGDSARARVGAEEVAHQEIASLKFLQILVDNQAHKQVALGLFLVAGGEFVESLDKDLIGWPIADFVNKVALDSGDGPGRANGGAALRNDALEPDVAAEGDRHPAFLEHLAVQINLGEVFGVIAAGQPAQDRQGRVGFIPLAQPALRIQVKRVGKDQPAVALFRADAGFQMPVTRAVGFLDLFLSEVKRLQVSARQREQAEYQASRVFHFTGPDDATGARTSNQQRNLTVDPEDFQNLSRVREKARGEKHQPQGGARRGELLAQLFGPGLKPGLVKTAVPMSRDSEFVSHENKLAGSRPMANQKRIFSGPV